MRPGLRSEALLPRGVMSLAMLLLMVAPVRAADEALKLRLTYGFPKVDTDIRHDASATIQGSSFSAEDTLRAETSQLLPGFELDLNTGGLGRYVLEYYEFRLRGADFLREPVFFDAVFFPRGVPVRSRYEFRTLNLSAILALPLLDFVDIDLRASIRYVDFYTSISAPTAFRAADDRTSTLVPTIGGGAEFFILDQVYLFGSFQTLGYSVDGKRTSSLLFLDDDSNVFTRDWRLGVRWELLSFASISLEWRSLALRIKKGKARHRQDVDGFTLSLEIGLF